MRGVRMILGFNVFRLEKLFISGLSASSIIGVSFRR